GRGNAAASRCRASRDGLSAWAFVLGARTKDQGPRTKAQRPKHKQRNMFLTLDQTRWVAHLARLELSDAELADMTRQLSAILDYVQQLNQVNTAGVEPLAH